LNPQGLLRRQIDNHCHVNFLLNLS
jgi:hypothetical protein